MITGRLHPSAAALAAGFLALASTAFPSRADEPYNWKNVQIVGGGFVDGIVASPAQPGLMYARTDVGGAYRWDAASRRWIPMTDFVSGPDNNLIGIESLGIDPSNPNIVYLAAGTYIHSSAGKGAIFRSTDQGTTWHRSDLPIKVGSNEDGRFAGERLAVDPNLPSAVYFGSRKDGLWRSTDFGSTWNKVTAFPDIPNTGGIGIAWVTPTLAPQPTPPPQDNPAEPDGGDGGQRVPGRGRRPLALPDTPAGPVIGNPMPFAPPTVPAIYCGVSTRGLSVYRSYDHGSSWEAVPNQPTGLLPNHGVMASDGSLYITYGDAPGPNGMTRGAVWKLDTTSDIWTDVTPVKPSAAETFGYGGLAVDAQQPQTVMVTTMDRWKKGDECFRSTDGGLRWIGLKDQAVLNWSISPWITFGDPKPKFGWWMGALAIDPFDSDHVLFGTGATIWASGDITLADKDEPTHWEIGAKGIEELVVNNVISPPSGAPLLSAVWDIDGLRSADLAVSPKAFYQPSYGRDTDIAFAYKKPDVMARVSSKDSAAAGAYSLDNGVTWMPFATMPPGKGDGAVAVSADGSTVVWSESSGSTYLTHDNGKSWTHSTGIPEKAAVTADCVDPTTFYAVDSENGAVWVSKDGGLSFGQAATGFKHGTDCLRASPAAASDLWLGTDAGLYHSVDGGQTFTQIPGINQAHPISFGKAAPGQEYPAVFLVGTVQGRYGFYRSDDAGKTWVRINDDAHQFGWIGSMSGDPRVYGRVYIGTGGRGVLYGDPAGTDNSTDQ